MERFAAYSLPIQGLKTGTHHFKYTLDAAFFRHFEGSPIGEAQVEVKVTLDKRSDMMLFDFGVTGWVREECDRCTAQIDLPVEDERELIVKYGEPDEAEEDEVVFIPREAPEFNLAKYLYEFAVLALPITNTYDCANDPVPPCNFEVLAYLKTENDNDEDAPSDNPAWDALKNLNDN